MRDNPTELQASGTQERRPVRVWQLVLGILFLAAGVYNLIGRPVGPMEPGNETQWFGYYLATAFYLLVGLIFVLFGTRVLPRKAN